MNGKPKKRETITKKLFQLLFHRVVLVGLAILAQLAILLVMLLRFQEYFVYFYAISITVSVAAVLYIINNRSNPAYKIAWIIPILLVPVFGGIFYLMLGGNQVSRREQRRLMEMGKNIEGIHQISPSRDVDLKKESADAYNQSEYIRRITGAPPYQNTSVEYLPLGEIKFARMLEELEKAEHYIFLEYFIIQEGGCGTPSWRCWSAKPRPVWTSG